MNAELKLQKFITFSGVNPLIDFMLSSQLEIHFFLMSIIGQTVVFYPCSAPSCLYSVESFVINFDRVVFLPLKK
jgi:hypothetical protein